MSIVKLALRRKSRRRLLAGDVPGWVARNPNADYLAAVLRSTPEWADARELLALDAEARARSRGTGEAWHIDHVIPLRHPRVCGLTVPNNLRIIRAGPNMAKGGRWDPDQASLFPDDEEDLPPFHQRALL